MKAKATKPTAADALTRDDILRMLTRFVNQRPGFDPHNYGTLSDLRSDQRVATRDRAAAHAMLSYIGWNSGITADMLRKELRGSGRLSLSDSGKLDYCTGQYWCTEFRAGVCRVLSAVIWEYVGADIASDRKKAGHADPHACGDAVRASCRREFGRSVAARWFN